MKQFGDIDAVYMFKEPYSKYFNDFLTAKIK